jgi:hypothetical protein
MGMLVRPSKRMRPSIAFSNFLEVFVFRSFLAKLLDVLISKSAFPQLLLFVEGDRCSLNVLAKFFFDSVVLRRQLLPLCRLS